MATHIIIPIKELTEDGIKFIESLSGHTAKQISLDEKDISDKSLEAANKLYDSKTEGSQWVCSRIGYKQALKDLYGTD